MSALITNRIMASRKTTEVRAPQAVVPQQVLMEIEWYLANHFETHVKSVQTGCGEATLLFLAYGAEHEIYCADDRDKPLSIVEFIQSWPEKSKIPPRWIFGETTTSLTTNPPVGKLDLILINGNNAYPAPDVEAMCLLPRLKVNGLLAVVGREIPTTDALCRFLEQEDGLRYMGSKSGAGFFVKVYEPQYGHGWQDQRFNLRHFAYTGTERPDFGMTLPIEIRFSPLQINSQPILKRGFANDGQGWFSEGPDGVIELKFADPPQSVQVEIDIVPIAVSERRKLANEVEITVQFDWREIAKVAFENDSALTLKLALKIKGQPTARLEIWHRGLVAARELAGFNSKGPDDMRLPGFWLKALRVLDPLVCAKKTNAVTRADGSVCSFDDEGHRFHFFVADPNDTVSNFHANGRFYERAELERLRALVKPGGRILEVGSHVGNHSVFFNAFLKPKRIVVVEPNPRSRETLALNLRLNRVTCTDLSFAAHALGAQPGHGDVVPGTDHNSGGSQIAASPIGAIKIETADRLFKRNHFDFIKIDVEGMEIDILEGMRDLIMRSAPLIFVEVIDANRAIFLSFTKSVGYIVKWEGSMYEGIGNYIITKGRQLASSRTASRQSRKRSP